MKTIDLQSGELSEFCWNDGRLRYVRKHAAHNIAEVARGFYADGSRMFEYPMRSRRLHGIGVVYYSNGKKKKESPYRLGRLDGIVREWDEQGQLRKRETFVRGVRYGLSIEWDASGRFLRQELFLLTRGSSAVLNKRIERSPICAKDVLETRNAEIRRIFIEELGYERLLAGVEHEVLHQQGDQELVRIDLPEEEESIVLVKVKCPSTGAFYVLRVPPEMQTVRQSVAWTFGCDEAEYQPAEEA